MTELANQIIQRCPHCGEMHDGRLDGLNTLLKIGDDRRHPIELRLLAEAVVQLRLMADRVKEIEKEIKQELSKR